MTQDSRNQGFRILCNGGAIAVPRGSHFSSLSFTANNLWAAQSTTAREESVLFTRGARLIFLHSLGKFLLYFFFFQIKHGQLLIDLCLPPFFFSHRRRRYRVPRAGNEVRVPAVGVEPER